MAWFIGHWCITMVLLFSGARKSSQQGLPQSIAVDFIASSVSDRGDPLQFLKALAAMPVEVIQTNEHCVLACSAATPAMEFVFSSNA